MSLLIKPFKDKWLDLLVNGYIMDILGEYAPNIVVHKIILFYNTKNNDPFNIFHYGFGWSWNKINSDGINNIIAMYTIGSSQYYITNDNKLYVNGSNLNGRHGLGSIFYNGKFTHNTHFDDKDIILISEARHSFHCIIYADNKLYGAGDNRDGQLCPIERNGVKTQHDAPKIICDNVYNMFKSEIIQIETGSMHTLILTQNGNIYGSGRNDDGQLSLNGKSEYYNMSLLDEFSNIISIRCGLKNSYVLDKFGKMTAFGVILKTSGIPDFNTKLAKYDVMSINTGARHACFITKKYELYFFDGNNFYQCGTSDPTAVKSPLKLEFDADIIEIQCGGYHNIMKTNNNKYYGFGRNEKKQCSFGLNGNENSDSLDKPQYISLKKLKENIGNNNDIIGFKPSFLDTYVIQLN